MTLIPLEISNFFLAMQAGKPGASTLGTQFAQDAVYQEPFSGDVRTHQGRKAIMDAIAMGWETGGLQDAVIGVERAETRGDEIFISWVCKSPTLPGGEGRGLNRFKIENGEIVSLITTLTGEL